jgi:arylsulfatase A-like enzyme
VAAGSSSDRVSGFEDWIPTILDLAGLSDATPDNIDGISLAPTLLGKEQAPRPFLYREFSGYGGQQSVRSGQWKAIRTGMGKGNLEIELYNLSDDPGEQTNVADRHPDVVERLKTRMDQQHTASELFPLRPLDGPVVKRRKKPA